MKKAIVLIFTLFLALCLASCGSNKDNDPVALDAPVISLTGNVVSWEAVTNASGYIVNVDGNNKPQQTETSYTLTGESVGNHNVNVVAIGDSVKYLDSVASNIVTYVVSKLSAPVITLMNNVVSWTAVSNASGYIVTINGDDKPKQTGTSYTISETAIGEYDIKVIAVGNGTTYSNSDFSNIEKYIISVYSRDTSAKLSANGYATGQISSMEAYENTSYYATVTTGKQFFQAILDAKQGKVKVIEIENDLNLGWYKLSSEEKAFTNANAFKSEASIATAQSSMVKENGISQISIENITDLLIYSKTGAKITHAGFKITSCHNLIVRNISFDEMWEWEDTDSYTKGAIGDYDSFGWAYMKISFCGYVWIDHCDFGKAFDGLIDYSNPDYTSTGTAFRAPSGADGGNGLHISWCNFNSGSDDQNGYIYKMMREIEDSYQLAEDKYLYYKTLRDGGLTFDDILYGIAIPQKKGFLVGDGDDITKADWEYNFKIQISMAYCKFVNLEDRIPRLRGGNAYIYNCYVDCSEYYAVRTRLKSKIFANNTKDAAGLVTAKNSTWKLALVSQAILPNNQGSVKAENCIFEGVDTLIKCNNKNTSDHNYDGGFEIVNCSWRKGLTDTTYLSNESSSRFVSSNPNNVIEFFWRTADGLQPFTPSLYSLEDLKAALNNSEYGSGTTSTFKENFLRAYY